MPPRIPKQEDFAPLSNKVNIALHFPSPPESTTAFLILFHGLGDHEAPFANFAHNLSLPGVLAISVRGTSPLPPSLLSDGDDGDQAQRGHFHWGDDLTLNTTTGDLDDDPGFSKAEALIMNSLVRETLIDKCGWEMADVILFGFGQGGSLALGLASKQRGATSSFKGVVSIGGPLPHSMVPTVSGAREKSKTSVLLCQLDGDAVDAAKKEFVDVEAVRWKRRDVAMPRDRDEVFPIMKFFADRLRAGW